MSWKPKRFWTQVCVKPMENGFAVFLDDRLVKTPAKAALVVPTAILAEALADEWRAQEKEVDPAAMPLTCMANSAIDKVAVQFDAVAGMIADYGASDLLCYREAEEPSLQQAQAQKWDPLLDWAQQRYGVKLRVTKGVMFVPQPLSALDALRRAVFAQDPFGLAALHDLVAISGSLVLGLAVIEGHISADAAFRISRTDEDWQSAIWGHDEDHAMIEARKLNDFLCAARFYMLACPRSVSNHLHKI